MSASRTNQLSVRPGGNPTAYLVAWSLLVVVFTVARAQIPLWYDEVFTYHMAHLPNLAAVWTALTEGADLNPPLFHVVTRASVALFGDAEWALRVPATAGFLVMGLCLYRFVTKWCRWPYGLLALVVPACTGAYRYAYEARPYGMVLGFCGLAMVCWQAATTGNSRRLSLIGLTAALSGALLSHCYAVLLLIPFAGGELVRTYTKKTADWPVWASLTIPALSVVTYLPLLAFSGSVLFDNELFRPRMASLYECFQMLLAPAACPIVLSLALVVLVKPPAQEQSETRGFPRHEIALVTGLAMIPIFALALATLLDSAFMTRYGLAAVPGLTVLFVAGVSRHSSESSRLGGAMAVLFIVTFIVQFGSWITPTPRTSPPPAETVMRELPFVTGSGLQFLEKDFYGNEEFTSRLYYLSDPEVAVRQTGSNVFEQVLPVAAKWFPVRGKITAYDRFVRSHQHFLVYAPVYHPLDWLMGRLRKDGARLRLLDMYGSRYGDTLLLEVTMPAQMARSR